MLDGCYYLNCRWPISLARFNLAVLAILIPADKSDRVGRGGHRGVHREPQGSTAPARDISDPPQQPGVEARCSRRHPQAACLVDHRQELIELGGITRGVQG